MEQSFGRRFERWGYVVVGYTASYGNGGNDAWLIKLDSHGNIEWNKTIGGSNNDGARVVLQTEDGGFIIAGGTTSYGAGESDGWLIKTDSAGEVEWFKTFGGVGVDLIYSADLTNDGGYVILGCSDCYNPVVTAWVKKLDKEGNVEWSKTFQGNNIKLKSISHTTDGGFIIAGDTYSDVTYSDIWVIKLDKEGNVEWSKTFNYYRSDLAFSVKQTMDGGFVVAGYSDSFGPRFDILVIKLDPRGNTEWVKSFEGEHTNLAYSIQQTSEGGYIIAGERVSSGNGDILIVKLSPEQTITIPEAPILVMIFLIVLVVMSLLKFRV